MNNKIYAYSVSRRDPEMGRYMSKPDENNINLRKKSIFKQIEETGSLFFFSSVSFLMLTCLQNAIPVVFMYSPVRSCAVWDAQNSRFTMRQVDH